MNASFTKLTFKSIIMGMVLFLGQSFAIHGQNKKIDSFVRGLETADTAQEKIRFSLKLFSLKIHNNPAQAMQHLELANGLSKTLDNDSISFVIYSKYVNHYFLKQDHEPTFKYIDSALQFKNSISPKKIANLHVILAQMSNLIGDYDQALKGYFTALSICQEYKIEKLKIGILNGLSGVYSNNEDYENGEIYADKAVDLARKSNNEMSLMYASRNLGQIYFKQKRNAEALAVFNDIERYLKKHKNVILQHSVNTTLGRWYKENQQYDSAIGYFNDNLSINQSIKNEIGINTTRSDMAHIKILQKKYTEAILMLSTNLQQAKKLNNANLLKQSYLNLSQVYELTNNYHKALDNRKDYEKWHDSIINDNNLKAISELEIKYQTEKKENEILGLNAQKLQDDVAMADQQTNIRRLSLSLLVAILVFGGLFIIFRQRSKNQKQKALISAIADTQIEERKRIAQDLHDGVGGTLALAKNKLESMLSTEKEKSAETSDLIKTLTITGEQIRQISHNMMPGELVKFGLISAVQSTLEQIDNKQLKTHLYTHDLKLRIDQTMEIHLYRIIQEIIQNVLKHANATNLNIHLNKYAKKLSLLIEDDGIGFSASNAVDGIGLQNIKNRVAFLNGKFQIDSGVGKGTTFNIQIPLQ